MLATVGVFGMRKLATRLRLEHAAALGTKEERARLFGAGPRVLPRRDAARAAEPSRRGELAKAAAAGWRSHFEDAGSDDSVVDVYE